MKKIKKKDAENFHLIGLPPLFAALHPIVDVDRLWIRVLIPRQKSSRVYKVCNVGVEVFTRPTNQKSP